MNRGIMYWGIFVMSINEADSRFYIDAVEPFDVLSVLTERGKVLKSKDV